MQYVTNDYSCLGNVILSHLVLFSGLLMADDLALVSMVNESKVLILY